MPFTRANPVLSEIIEILDMHLARHQGDENKARKYLSKADNEWVDGEIFRCMIDARYFISNYYFYRDENEGFRGLYPFFDAQEIIHEELELIKKKYGTIRAIILKARQMGSTTYNCARLFHSTIFSEHINALIVGQDESQSTFVQSMYQSALDFIPWWMKPRVKSNVKGNVIEFDERDETTRSIRPGLKTFVYVDNAKKPSGVGRGKTFQRALLTELAFWENADQLSESLLPTFNSKDGFYVMESTAKGRGTAWHNLWQSAEGGELDFHPIFIPFYRRPKTYSLPIPEGDRFELTTDECELKERITKKEGVVIPDATFNWIRKRKAFFRATSGDDQKFQQEYPSNPDEAFQASGVTAFPRSTLNRLAKRTREPRWIGEISFDRDRRLPELHIVELGPKDKAPYPKTENRLMIWEKVEKGATYGLGADVALGNPGGDYSTVQIIKKGGAIQKDKQVAVWHGHINPIDFAEIVVAMGTYYNEALLAVEVNAIGTTTNYEIMYNYEYENIYRYKRLDTIKNSLTNFTGFLSSWKSTNALMARMAQFLVEDSLDVPCRFTVNEFFDFTEDGAEGKGAHDDLVDALMICLYCLYEGEIRDRSEGRKKHVPQNSSKFQILDRFGTIIAETPHQAQAEMISNKHIGSTINRSSGSTAKITMGSKVYAVPSDFQNTAFSPIHDKDGTASKLYYEEGHDAEAINYELIAEYEEMNEDAEGDHTGEAWKYA